MRPKIAPNTATAKNIRKNLPQTLSARSRGSGMAATTPLNVLDTIVSTSGGVAGEEETGWGGAFRPTPSRWA